MTQMTYLRALRLRYGVSLLELERCSGLSNQYLSALELGKISCSAQHEKVIEYALEKLIKGREAELRGLQCGYQTCRGRLFQSVEVEM